MAVYSPENARKVTELFETLRRRAALGHWPRSEQKSSLFARIRSWFSPNGKGGDPANGSLSPPGSEPLLVRDLLSRSKIVQPAALPVFFPPAALPTSLEGIYEVEAEAFFAARHYVRTHDGSGPIHNHFYRVQIRCSGQWLDENQCLVGFAELKRIMGGVLKSFNGQLLNDLPAFHSFQPTTEALVAVIYHLIRAEARDLPVAVNSLTVWETPTVSITFTPKPERP